MQLDGEEARRLVADTHRKALDALARDRSTLAEASGAPPQLRPGMQVSVLHGFNVKGEKRYDAATFRTNDGWYQYPDSARRWYTATVVAHGEGCAWRLGCRQGSA